jgi:hypothetical protein
MAAKMRVGPRGGPSKKEKSRKKRAKKMGMQKMKNCLPLTLVGVLVRGLTTASSHRLIDFNSNPWTRSKLEKSLLPSSGVKTGILCHGCHLQTEGWENIVWGSSKSNQLGRLPHASLLSIQENASILVMGSGGSHTKDGLTEGEFTLNYFKKNLNQLNDFHDIAKLRWEKSQITEMMERIVVCETESVNTLQEIEHACELFSRCGVERVILVSSPTHIPRCIRDACVVFDKCNYHPMLLASPSQISYEGFSASDICVVEPGHRGDRDKRFDGSLSYHKLVPRAMRIANKNRFEFANELNQLITKYENRDVAK